MVKKILVITLILIAGLFLFSASQTLAQPDCEINADCDDGLYCTGDEVCSVGSCQAGSPPCPPLSICDEASGECLCSTDFDCDDGVDCTEDTCGAFSAVCHNTPINSNCDDGNVCTDDSCNPASGCVNTNNTAPCDDGDPTTGNDTCSDGVCIGEPNAEAIPTLSEWGMIIFMTIILGLGVATLLRTRKTVV